MAYPEFTRTFLDLESKGFDIHEAEYSGDSLGNWLIEFSSKTVRRHRLFWDGRDICFGLECERPKSERVVTVPPEQLRQMSYEDGVRAYHVSKAEVWQRLWVGA